MKIAWNTHHFRFVSFKIAWLQHRNSCVYSARIQYLVFVFFFFLYVYGLGTNHSSEVFFAALLPHD